MGITTNQTLPPIYEALQNIFMSGAIVNAHPSTITARWRLRTLQDHSWSFSPKAPQSSRLETGCRALMEVETHETG